MALKKELFGFKMSVLLVLFVAIILASFIFRNWDIIKLSLR